MTWVNFHVAGKSANSEDANCKPPSERMREGTPLHRCETFNDFLVRHNLVVVLVAVEG